MNRVSVFASAEGAEEARAAVLELFPEGFEERDVAGGVELAAYADAAREEHLRELFGTVTVTEVEEGWEERWREFHRGIRVGPLWVGPPWEEAPSDAHAVVIDPGRAFGTGAHATTRLCLELLTTIRGGSLLDIGCGSGVLAIAGAKLGFGPVSAIDVDPEAVRATERNAQENGVAIDVRIVDALTQPLPAAETVVANLTLDTVRELTRRVRGTRLVSSGYLAGDDLAPDDWDRRDRREADGWTADLWLRQPK